MVGAVQAAIHRNRIAFDDFGAKDSGLRLVECSGHLRQASAFGIHDVIGQDHREGFIADQLLGHEYSVAKSKRFGLADIADASELRNGARDLQQIRTTFRAQCRLELRRAIEVVLHRRLATAGDDDDVGAACCDRLFHRVLDQRLVDKRKHLLGSGLGGG